MDGFSVHSDSIDGKINYILLLFEGNRHHISNHNSMLFANLESFVYCMIPFQIRGVL